MMLLLGHVGSHLILSRKVAISNSGDSFFLVHLTTLLQLQRLHRTHWDVKMMMMMS